MHFGYDQGFEWHGAATCMFGWEPGGRSVPTNITIITNRWHEYTRPGTTLVSIIVGRASMAYDAVDNGFGELVMLDQHDRFHRTNVGE